LKSQENLLPEILRRFVANKPQGEGQFTYKRFPEAARMEKRNINESYETMEKI